MERQKVERFVYVNGRKLPLLEDGRLSVYDYFGENTVLFDPNVYPSVEIALSTEKADKGVTLPRLLPHAHYHAFRVDPITHKRTPILSEYVCAYVMNLPSYTTPEMLGKFFERYDMVEKANVFPAKRSVCNGRGWVILHDRAKLRLVPRILEFEKGHIIFVELSDRSPEDLRSMLPPSHVTQANTITNTTSNNNNNNITNNNVNIKDKRNIMTAINNNNIQRNMMEERVARTNVFEPFHNSSSSTNNGFTHSTTSSSSRCMSTTPLTAMTSTVASAGSSSPEYVNVECMKTYNNNNNKHENHNLMPVNEFILHDCNYNNIITNDNNSNEGNYSNTNNDENNLQHIKNVAAESCNKEITPLTVDESQITESLSGNYLGESQSQLTSDRQTTEFVNGENNFTNNVEGNTCNAPDLHGNTNMVAIAQYNHCNNISEIIINTDNINVNNENMRNVMFDNKNTKYHNQSYVNSHVNEHNKTNTTNKFNNHVYSNSIPCNTETQIMQTTPSQLSWSTTDQTAHVSSTPSLPMETLPISFLSSSSSSTTLPQIPAPVQSTSHSQRCFVDNHANCPSHSFQPEQFCAGPNMMLAAPAQLPSQTQSTSLPPLPPPLPLSLSPMPLPITNMPPFTAASPMMAEYNGHNNFYIDNNISSNVNMNLNNEWMLTNSNLPQEPLPMSAIQRESVIPFITPPFTLTNQPLPASLLNSLPPHYQLETAAGTLPGHKYIDKRTPAMKKLSHRMETTNNFNSDHSLPAQHPRSSSIHARHQSPLGNSHASGFMVPVPRSSLANNNSATIQEIKQITSIHDKKSNRFSSNINKKGRTSSLNKANSKENVKVHVRINDLNRYKKNDFTITTINSNNKDDNNTDTKSNITICTSNEKETAAAGVMINNNITLSNKINNSTFVIEPIDVDTESNTIIASSKEEQSTQPEGITKYSEHELTDSNCHKSVECEDVMCATNITSNEFVNDAQEVQTKNGNNAQGTCVIDDRSTPLVRTPPSSTETKWANKIGRKMSKGEINAERTDSCVYYFVSHHTNKEMHRIWQDRYFYPSSLLLAQINRVVREERARNTKLCQFEIRLFFILAFPQPELFGIATVHHPVNEVNEQCYFAIGRACSITWLAHHLRMSATMLPRWVVGSLLLFKLRNGATVRHELAHAILEFATEPTANNYSNKKYGTSANNSRSCERTKQRSHESQNFEQLSKEEGNTNLNKLCNDSSETSDANNGLSQSGEENCNSAHCSNEKDDDNTHIEMEHVVKVNDSSEYTCESFLQEATTFGQRDNENEKGTHVENMKSNQSDNNNEVNIKIADLCFNDPSVDTIQTPVKTKDSSVITEIEREKQSLESKTLSNEMQIVQDNNVNCDDNSKIMQADNLQNHKLVEVITETVCDTESNAQNKNDSNHCIVYNNEKQEDFTSVCGKEESNVEVNSTVSHMTEQNIQNRETKIEQSYEEQQHGSLANQNEEKEELPSKMEQERYAKKVYKNQ